MNGIGIGGVAGPGFEVAEANAGTRQPVVLSRRFLVKSAAVTMMELLSKNGHPQCFVREVIGTEVPTRRRERSS